MTRELLDFNPVTGEKIFFQYDAHTDEMVITHEQDVDPIKEQAHFLATESDYTKHGMKNDLWHYAKVPNVVIMEMATKYGVDLFNKDHAKRVFELLNTEYKFLKTTERTHNVR